MAFCGALALQSFLGGRKVRDPADNRTNLYLLALAPTGSGKDYPRKINKIVLSHIGMGRASVLRFASGEAIEDKLAEVPCLLCQTDEIDGLLLQIKSSRDGRYESLMDRLKEIYTSADQSIMTRCLAKTQSTEVHQPSLTLLGSATPTHYYSALSEKMLTDGFFSRTICVEATADVEDQDPKIVELPERIIETANWWARYSPTPGNLASHNPSPSIVPTSDTAQELIREVRVMAREEQNLANAKNRAIDSAIWSRVRQMTHKLALIYAISKNHGSPRIDSEAVTWARDFAVHQARRMLFMAQEHVSNDELIERKAFFVVRQHATNVRWETAGRRRRAGKDASGRIVCEQPVRLVHPETEAVIEARRVEVQLKNPDKNGNTTLFVFTNVPAGDADAVKILSLYADRWTVETAIQHLKGDLRCEIDTLGYPKAALFGMCVALMAYNVVALTKGALRVVWGRDYVEDELSMHYLTKNVANVTPGMLIAIPEEDWNIFRTMSLQNFAKTLIELAVRLPTHKCQKQKRSPKKKPPKKIFSKKHKHVSTARVIAGRLPESL